jgi:hypothetical protein
MGQLVPLRDEITLELCPVLSIQQLYRISTMYWDDKYGTETVSQEVLVAMKELMMKDQNTNMAGGCTSSIQLSRSLTAPGFST